MMAILLIYSHRSKEENLIGYLRRFSFFTIHRKGIICV